MSDVVSEYYSKDRHRYALVVVDKSDGVRYNVELFENTQFVRVVDCMGHSEHYAEDVAENWVMGVLN